MVADWLAMSDEKKTDVFDWAEKNINKRWKFTKEQVQLINDLIGNVVIEKIIVVGKKEIGLGSIFKGGAGSGSWEGPGDPRFAHEDEFEGKEKYIVGIKDPAVSAIFKRGQEDAFIESLTTEESKALNEYKGEDVYAAGAAIALNGMLRDGEKLSDAQAKALEQINSAFRKAPRLKEDTMLYRGTDEMMKAGKYFIDSKAFISTSVKRNEAENFAGLVSGGEGFLYEIKVPKNFVAMPTSHFHKDSSIAEESEVLLPPGATIQIKSIVGRIIKAEVVGGELWMRRPVKDLIDIITKASPNALSDRFDFSGWAYKNSEWNKRLQAEGGLFIKEVYEAEGKRVWEQLALQLEDGLEGAFDIDNPLIAKFIENYSFPFAQGINETTVGMLQGAMTAGMDEGLGMDGIAKLIREVFDNCTRYRSQLIARTETIRASNGAAKMAYRQSEVVEGMEWLTTKDDRACQWCNSMNGKTISLNENFFNLGDKLTVGEGDNKSTMVFDYEDVGYPPLHVQCRCAVIPIVYDEFLIPKSIGLDIFFKGGPGSGNFGHGGRQGQVGGSGDGASTLPIVNQSSNDTMVNAAKTAISEGKSSNEFASAQMAKYKADPKVFWHGSPSGDLRGSAYGLHVGSFAAAEQALNARIGVPAEGSWDGTREYGKTLLAGK